MSVEYAISGTLLPVVNIKLQQGQRIYSSSGGMSWMTQQVQMETNILLGGQGLFLATLRGPGRVWLQTMPMNKLAQKIAQYIPQVGGEGQSGGVNINLGQLLRGQ